MQWLTGLVSAVVIFFSGVLGIAQVSVPEPADLAASQTQNQPTSTTPMEMPQSTSALQSTMEISQPVQTPLAAPDAPNKSTICNGTYYSNCSNGAAPICPKSGAAYCPLSQPAQQPTQQLPSTGTETSQSNSIQTAAECASLGLQKENSDRTDLLGTEIIVKDAYGYSPSLNTCLYAVQYEAPALNTDSGKFFDLTKGTIITLPQSGTWQMSWFSLPASEFVYSGYVYDCNNLPSFFSENNQTGQSAWVMVKTGAACGTVWVNPSNINVDQSVGTVASLTSNDSSSVNAFWNEYFTLVP